MREISKDLNNDLYPDLKQNGGLAPALRQVLDQLSCNLYVDQMSEPQMFVYAIVRTELRSSQVMVAAHQRSFSVDFWHQGVQYGHGWTPDLMEVGRAISAFNLGIASIQEMTSRFRWFEAYGRGVVHEKGDAAYFVATQWLNLERWLASEPDGSLLHRLLPLVIEAKKRVELKQLFPFTSLDRLCFSRTTGFPYTNDCPFAARLLKDDAENEQFGVLIGWLAHDDPKLLGKGNAVEAADILVKNLPPSCGSAIHGRAG